MSELKISNKDRIEGQIRLLDVAGKQIERLESENDKLTEENKRLREALLKIAIETDNETSGIFEINEAANKALSQESE